MSYRRRRVGAAAALGAAARDLERLARAGLPTLLDDVDPVELWRLLYAAAKRAVGPKRTRQRPRPRLPASSARAAAGGVLTAQPGQRIPIDSIQRAPGDQERLPHDILDKLSACTAANVGRNGRVVALKDPLKVLARLKMRLLSYLPIVGSEPERDVLLEFHPALVRARLAQREASSPGRVWYSAACRE